MNICNILKVIKFIITSKILFVITICLWFGWQLFTIYFMNYMDIIKPLKHTSIGLYKQNFDFLIFQIGFNKCGTTSLFNFMVNNDISSIHNTPCKYYLNPHEIHKNHLYLNQFMIYNLRNNETDKVLPIECTKYYQFYSDFGNEISGQYYILKRTVLEKAEIIDNFLYNRYIKKWYNVLTKQYKESKYILNIRNVNNWLKSKYLHRPPYFNKHRFNQRKQKINQFIRDYNYTKNLQRGYMTDIEILKIYKNQWYLYICNTIKYFKDNNIYNNLLIFNVESDSIEKIIEFFAKFGIILNGKYWKRKNKSSLIWISTQDQKQRNKWMEIESKYPEFSTDYTNVNETEYHRINAFCRKIR